MSRKIKCKQCGDEFWEFDAHTCHARYWCGSEMSEQYVIGWAHELGWKPETACGVYDAIAFLGKCGHKITILAPPTNQIERPTPDSESDLQ